MTGGDDLDRLRHDMRALERRYNDDLNELRRLQELAEQLQEEQVGRRQAKWLAKVRWTR